jgi:hypothetical protein
MTRLAARLTKATVYHVNGQREFPLPDVVIAEERTGPLTRAAEVAPLFDSERAAEAAEVETVRRVAKQVFVEQPFKYGARPGRR